MDRSLDMRDLREARTATKIVRREPGRSVRELTADVAVVGSGIAGVSAAIEAARLGYDVVLADALPTLGGQAVNGIIGTFVGLFSNGPDPDTHYQLTYGIADEILRDLGAQGALHYRRGQWTTVLYDEVALARWIENTILKEGVRPLLGATLRKVDWRGPRQIGSVEFATRYGDVRLSADYFIDATGDAALTWEAGLPCRVPAEGIVYGTQLAVLEGFDVDKVPDRTVIGRRLEEVGHEYGLRRKEGFVFAFPSRGTGLLNMNHVATPLDAAEISRKSLEGKDQVDKGVEFLRKEFPDAFANVRVRAYGQLGVRQTRWIVGRQQLTMEDVLQGTRFPDAVARTAWAIELHDREDRHIFYTFGEGHIHYVPFASMTPPDADNLIAAGRCIDGDVAALSSVRVMGPCIAMGAAAAQAVDLAKAGDGSVHHIDPADLRERVWDNVERMG